MTLLGDRSSLATRAAGCGWETRQIVLHLNNTTHALTFNRHFPMLEKERYFCANDALFVRTIESFGCVKSEHLATIGFCLVSALPLSSGTFDWRKE